MFTHLTPKNNTGVQISRYIANFGDRDIYLPIDATDSDDCHTDTNTVHAQNSSVDINSVQESTGDPRSTTFLVQRLVLDVQRGNVASVMAMLPSTKDWSEMGLLPAL